MKNQFSTTTDFLKTSSNAVYLYKGLWKEHTVALLQSPRDNDKTDLISEIIEDLTSSHQVLYVNTENRADSFINRFHDNPNLMIYTPFYYDPDDPNDYADLVFSGLNHSHCRKIVRQKRFSGFHHETSYRTTVAPQSHNTCRRPQLDQIGRPRAQKPCRLRSARPRRKRFCPRTHRTDRQHHLAGDVPPLRQNGPPGQKRPGGRRASTRRTKRDPFGRTPDALRHVPPRQSILAQARSLRHILIMPSMQISPVRQ